MLIMERQSRKSAPTDRQSVTNTTPRKNTAEIEPAHARDPISRRAVIAHRAAGRTVPEKPQQTEPANAQTIPRIICPPRKAAP